MPTEQPSNAADAPLSADARDDRNAASVLSDEQLDDAPGGGGLGGAAAVTGSARASGGAAPNAPLADAMGGVGEDEAGTEARTRAAGDTAAERSSL